MHIKRRDFIQVSSLATASLLIPKFLKAFDHKNIVPAGNKVVVIIQLTGGNDGLNTIIPITNDIYYKERPRLSIAKNEALQLNDDAGIHPSLTAFKQFYDNGELAILNDVGYPNPNRSHFRSMDIWQSASTSDEYVNTGWIGRYLDQACKNCNHPTQALEIDDVLSLALKGELQKGLAFKDPRRLYGTTQEKFFKTLAQQQHVHEHEKPVDYLYKTLSETVSSAGYIFEQSKAYQSSTIYPKTNLGNNLKTIASLILSQINTKVYYVSLGSFDTHINQNATQKRLFTELNDAVGAFVKDLKSNNRFEDVLIFTFSEFGRRVAQNASGGTDHGTANNVMLVSGGLKQKGLINALPDLSDLNEGDLQYKIDFKEIYATILNKWLQTDATKILGKKYSELSFI